MTTRRASLLLATAAMTVPMSACDKKSSSKPDGSAKRSPVTETCEDDFCIVATRGTGKVDFRLRSKAQAEVTVTLRFDLENMTSSVELPFTTTAKGAADQPLLTLSAAGSGGAFGYEFDYDWGYGLNTATHDDETVYRLPFAAGASFAVVQGYDGTFSHTGEDQYALDFKMPEGTPVHAAREGTVLKTEADYAAGGADVALKKKVNGVKIAHPDGTIGEYLHLKKGGVAVQKGQTVAAGELLGYSGNTGYTSGPHLHFKVSRRIDGATAESLRVKFKTAEASAQELAEGDTVTAVE